MTIVDCHSTDCAISRYRASRIAAHLIPLDPAGPSVRSRVDVASASDGDGRLTIITRGDTAPRIAGACKRCKGRAVVGGLQDGQGVTRNINDLSIARTADGAEILRG
jgi:hypothetical protein